jgi:hypothetical protein
MPASRVPRLPLLPAILWAAATMVVLLGQGDVLPGPWLEFWDRHGTALVVMVAPAFLVPALLLLAHSSLDAEASQTPTTGDLEHLLEHKRRPDRAGMSRARKGKRRHRHLAQDPEASSTLIQRAKSTGIRRHTDLSRSDAGSSPEIHETGLAWAPQTSMPENTCCRNALPRLCRCTQFGEIRRSLAALARLSSRFP